MENPILSDEEWVKIWPSAIIAGGKVLAPGCYYDASK